VTVCLAGLLILYGIATLWLLAGLFRRYFLSDKPPSVSLVICARNEEKSLPDLLKSLENIDYPKELLEIVLVNDRSTDNTGKLMSEFKQICQFSVTVVNIEEPAIVGYSERSEESLPPCYCRGEQKGCHDFSPRSPGGNQKGGSPGKMAALTQGLGCATGDIFVLTDADAELRPAWIRKLVAHFNENVGLVGGPVLIEGKGLWTRLQALDWAYLFAAGSGTAGWGFPQSVFGKNTAIRSETYREIGTLNSVPFSVTEDLALLTAIRNRTRWKIRLPMDAALAVATPSVHSLKSFWHQRRRWAVGGLQVGIIGRLLMLIMLLFSAAVLALLFIHPAWALGLFIMQCVLDLPFMASALGRLRHLSWIIYLPIYRLIFTILIVPLAVSLLFSRSVRWKEQVFR
jgi:cellulose synthase/poly-beta-1,6-N-acetylglucosamine synthase-like glycosyltransferase